MTLSLGASATDPAGSNDTLTYVYQVFKDGNAFASGSGVNETSFAFTPDDNGGYQIVLTVSDEDGDGDDEPDDRGGERSPLASITSISHHSTWIEGMTLSLGASATDPGGLERHADLR